MMKDTMDDKDYEQLRKEIKDLIKSLNMTQKEAADVVAEFLEEEKDFYQIFRKDLNRCKNNDKLINYLNALKESEKYRKLHNMQARYEGDAEVLGVKWQRFYQQLGKQIADHIKK